VPGAGESRKPDHHLQAAVENQTAQLYEKSANLQTAVRLQYQSGKCQISSLLGTATLAQRLEKQGRNREAPANRQDEALASTYLPARLLTLCYPSCRQARSAAKIWEPHPRGRSRGACDERYISVALDPDL
jgi:hypothetical protein